jgi:uncharacterized membrane protein HdeD (DUF308 family)
MNGFLEIGGLVAGILSILVGLIVIFKPRVLAYVIGGYFIIVGVLAVIAALS